MSIELKITVNHATDLAAEVRNLAHIFFPINNVDIQTVGGEEPEIEQGELPLVENKAVTTGNTTKKVTLNKTLNRKEQDDAVVEMVKNGAKDDRFDMLTKARQAEVEASLKKEQTVTDVDDMFGEEDDVDEKVTREMVSDMMSKVCKKADGTAIQNRALKVREILVDLIPDGQEIKVRNIPEVMLNTAYDKIKNVANIAAVD